MIKKMETGRDNPDVVKIHAKKLWVSDDGVTCVVKAIFPHGFVRSQTSSFERAKIRHRGLLYARGANGRSSWVLCLCKHVLDEKNEWGEVAP